MSKSNVLGIGFALLVLGFALGWAVANSRVAPPPAPTPTPTPAPVAETKPAPTQIFVPPVTREPVLEILTDAVLEPDGFNRVTRLAAVLPALGPDSIPEIRSVLEDVGLDPGGAGTELMLRWWARHEPAGAANWASLKAPRGFKAIAIMAVIHTWAAEDPQAAWAHVQDLSLLGSEYQDVAQISLVRGWFDSGRPGLTDFLAKMGPGDARQRAISVYARKTIQRDGVDAIIRWADAVPGDDRSLKLDVHRRVSEQVALVDPQAAADWCDRICDGPFGSNVRSLIAQRWAATSGRDAMEWVSRAPLGRDETRRAVKGAYRGWLQRDRDGLMEWVDAIGVEGIEPWLQPAVELLAVHMGLFRSPEEGLRWAEAITDPVTRDRATVTVVRNWRKRDPTAVDAWMDEVDLSEELRERVLWEPPRGSGLRSQESEDAADDETAGDDAAGDEAADDEMAGDEAAGDEAAGDEAAGDEAAGDEAAPDAVPSP